MNKTDKTVLTVQVTINAPMEKVWNYFTNANDITHWYFAADTWHAPSAENDLQVNGKFKTRMEAKDGSFGFDLEGIYTAVEKHQLIEYYLPDSRQVKITFSATADNMVEVVESFEAETQNPLEMQQGGWQAILNNFKKYTESH